MNDLTEKIKKSGGLRRFVESLLDRIDRTGNIPGSFSHTVQATADADAVKWFFGPLCVSVNGDKVSLNLKKIAGDPDEFVARLYQALGRSRQNLKEESRSLSEMVAELLKKFVSADSAILSEYVHSELEKLWQGRGELLAMARQQGLAVLEKHLACLQRGLNFLEASSVPVRLSRFGLEVNGDTKSCRSGSPLLKTFARLLYQFSSVIRQEVDLSEPQNESEKLRLTLEQTGLQLDGSANQFQVFGNLVLIKNGERFDYVNKHALFGEPVVLTCAQLEKAKIAEVPRQVVTIENETTFFEYAQNADPSKELVICSMGQANRLLVKFLEQLKGFVDSFYHWGDLDRSGVLILDSLRRRSGCDIQPLKMNSETFLANKGKGQALSEEEKYRLESLLRRRPDIICNDLLKTILAHNLWIEQENL
ncbi:MAG: hypothetical protein CVV41_05885 [Candidatus Riflebacteria bacterium HGW-Riflebacteria-1]|jgi:hypothetical protein|nr:MAG: hypothetical protein CVV41_05885 [Candidatus Riflebacteria bacterium HGW-Riflebacteria-1]